MLLKFKSYCY